MTLQLRDIPTTVADSAAIAQSVSPQLSNLDENSPFAALLYAAAYNNDYLQYLVLSVLAQTRLSTCVGADVDSFCADFGLTRLAGSAATGTVTFSRFTATGTALIVPGVTVKTADGTQSFTVTADTTNAAWNVGLGGYLIGSNVVGVTVPVAANTLGTGGNVQAGTITQITTSIPGIDTVSNNASFTNGLNGETDAAFKARFARYLNTLEKGTINAIGFAIDSVQQGLTYTINESMYLDHSARTGFISVWFDDGSGAAPAALQQKVSSAVNATRAGGINYGVQAAAPVLANVAVAVAAMDGYVSSNLTAPVQTAITNYINSTAVGDDLSFYRLSQVAQDSVPGVARINGLTLNGATGSDLPIQVWQTSRAGTIAVTSE